MPAAAAAPRGCRRTGRCSRWRRRTANPDRRWGTGWRPARPASAARPAAGTARRRCGRGRRRRCLRRPTGGANACGMGSGIVCWKPAGGCAGEGMPRDAAGRSGGGGRDGRGRARHDDDAVVAGRAGGRRFGLGDAVDGHVARHAAHHDLERLLLGEVDQRQGDRRAGQLVGADDLDLPLPLPFRQDLAQGRLLGLEGDLAVPDDERDAGGRRAAIWARWTEDADRATTASAGRMCFSMSFVLLTTLRPRGEPANRACRERRLKLRRRRPPPWPDLRLEPARALPRRRTPPARRGSRGSRPRTRSRWWC